MMFVGISLMAMACVCCLVFPLMAFGDYGERKIGEYGLIALVCVLITGGVLLCSLQ